MSEQRICANCGELFEPGQPGQRYCTSQCAKASVPKPLFAIFERDGFQCVYCGRSPYADHVVLTVDHIIPVAAGGDDRAINLATCCQGCNLRKGSRRLASQTEAAIRRALSLRNQAAGLLDHQRIALGGSAANQRGTPLSVMQALAQLSAALKAQDVQGAPIALGAVVLALRDSLPLFVELTGEQAMAEEAAARLTWVLDNVGRHIWGTNPDPLYTTPMFDLSDTHKEA